VRKNPKWSILNSILGKRELIILRDVVRIYIYNTHIHLYVICVGFRLRSKVSVGITKNLIMECSFEEPELITYYTKLNESDILRLMQWNSSSIVVVDSISVDGKCLVIDVWHNHITSLVARVLELKRYMKLVDSRI